MTQFSQKKFSVSMGLSEEGRNNWDKAFKKNAAQEALDSTPSAPPHEAMVSVSVNDLLELLGSSPDELLRKKIREIIQGAQK